MIRHVSVILILRFNFFNNLIQVIDIQEDVTILSENDNFLFDEQVIQDERLLNLEMETETIEEEVEGRSI